MKKSKIIVPAVALLALGMAASVTGTVAWFTVNKSADLDALTTASMTAPDSSFLKMGVLALSDDTAASTTADLTDATAVAFTDNHILTDVSSANGKDFFKWVGGETDPASAGAAPISEASASYLAVTGNPSYNASAIGSGGSASHTTTYDFPAAKAGSIAYLRYGFYIHNVNESALDVTVNSISLTDPSGAARISVSSGVVAGSKDDATVPANTLPTALAEGGTVYAAAQESLPAAAAFSNAPFAQLNLASGSYKWFIVTIWLEGNDAQCNVDDFQAGSIVVPAMKFTAEIHH